MKKSLPKAQGGAFIKSVGKGFKTMGTLYKEERALRAANKLAEAKRVKRAEAAARAAETRKANAAAKKAEADKIARAEARKTKKPATPGKQLSMFDEKGKAKPKAKSTAPKPAATKPKVESKKPTRQPSKAAQKRKEEELSKKSDSFSKSDKIGLGIYAATAATAIAAGIASNSGKKGDAKAIKESKPDWTKPTAPAPSTDANTNSVAKRVLKSAGRYKFAKGGFKKK